MANHQEFIDLALEMINEDGRTVTFQKLSKVAADPNKPWQGQGTPTVADTQGTKAVFLPAFESMFGRELIAKSELKRCEQVCLVPPTAKLLEGFDVVIDTDGQRWGIEWIQTLKPADQICLYFIGVKR